MWHEGRQESEVWNGVLRVGVLGGRGWLRASGGVPGRGRRTCVCAQRAGRHAGARRAVFSLDILSLCWPDLLSELPVANDFGLSDNHTLGL
jgi:hypothetical protein